MKKIISIFISGFLLLHISYQVTAQSHFNQAASKANPGKMNQTSHSDSLNSIINKFAVSDFTNKLPGHKTNNELKKTLIGESIPNAFTPNGDQYNDVFLKSYEVKIIDRWGKELFHGTEGWDGKYNGNDVAAGTYLFIQSIRDSAGKLVDTHKGTVLLIRE